MAQDLRSLFLLRPEVVFLNHGSFGACPRPVFDDYQHWQRELEAQPVEFLASRTQLLPQARAALATYVGCARDDLVFIPNATTGVSAVARSLPLQEGDEVLCTDHEYGACDRAWQFACQRTGARYVKAQVPLPARTRQEVVDTIWSAVTPRTRVIFISHITSPTAVTFPVEEVIRRARQAGIWTLIDGAHAVGQLPLDLTALDVDFYAGNCHKWLMAPKGTGFLYVRKELQHLVAPPITSWGRPVDAQAPNPFVDEWEWQGTRDIAPFLAVPAAIHFQQEHDWPSVRDRCHELATWVRSALLDLTGTEPLTPDTREWYEQMVAVQLPPCDGVALHERLRREHNVEIPVRTWSGRQVIRVSVQGYVTRADMETLLKVLPRLLSETRTN